MLLRREPDHHDLGEEDTSEEEIAEILVVPLFADQDDNLSDSDNGWMIAGFGENNENILEVLADNLIPSVSDDDDILESDISDSDSFGDGSFSEVLNSLANDHLSSSMSSIPESNDSFPMNSSGIMPKDCSHCKCVHSNTAQVTQELDSDRHAQQIITKHGSPDLTLVAGSFDVPCHKAAISACSEYFEAMFESRMMESTQDRIELKEVDGLLLDKLIKFAYSHTLVCDMKSVADVMTTARMLQFHEVISLCAEYVKKHLDVSNCLEMMVLSSTLAVNGLFNTASRLALWEADHIVHTHNFLHISQDTLMEYLCHNMLNLPEFEVYEALIRWVEFKQEERQTELSSIFRTVRFGQLSESQLLSMENNHVVQANPECVEIVQEARRLLQPDNNHSNGSTKLFLPSRYIPHKLLLIGGEFESEREDSVEKFPNLNMYQYRDGVFERKCPARPLTEQEGDLVGYRCCVLGKDLYMSGGELKLGRNKWCQKLLKYDSFSEEWTELCEMTHPRRHHSMVAWGKHIYLVGGFGKHRIMLDSVDRYDTQIDEWESMPSLNMAVYSAGVCVCDEKLYVIKHNVECFTPKAPRWVNVAVPLPFEIGIFNCIPYGRKIYMVGSYIKNLVEFDTDSRLITTIGKFSIASGPAVLCDRVIYVVGGQDTKDVETYNLDTKEFGVSCKLPLTMSNHHCFALPDYPTFRTSECSNCAM